MAETASRDGLGSDAELGTGTASDAEHILEAARQGELVILTGDAAGDASRDAHLYLAAELASGDAVQRMLEMARGPLVLTATRDRLERFGLRANPAPDDGSEELAGPAGDVAALAAFASRLAENGESAPARLDPQPGLVVRCADWGGVVNCPRAFEAAVDLSRLAGLAPIALTCRLERNGRSALASIPTLRIRQLVEYRQSRAPTRIHRRGPQVRLPTRYGTFELQVYEDFLTGQLHLALWMGELTEPVLTRMHSECLTGDLLGSQRCDCGDQLAQALTQINEQESGLLLYLRQEGRGIGLINKLRSYVIQDQGFDTVEANERLGFAADMRDYSLAASMLEDLDIGRVRLLTNNPRKTRGLEQCGIVVCDRVPLVVEPSTENHGYLSTKRDKLGHWLP